MLDLNTGSIYTFDPNPAGAPAVLLIHALGVDHDCWTLQYPALIEAGLRPLAVDLPGFGRSSLASNARWSVPWVAAQLAGLVERSGLSSLYVVGLSLGGVVAQQFALDYPACVSRLVLANTFARLRPRGWSELIYLLGRVMTASLRGVKSQAPQVARRIFPGAEQGFLRQMVIEKIHQADERAYRAAMRELALFDSRRRLKDLRVPTLVMTGACDNTVPPDLQLELVHAIPNARQVMLPGAGHAACIDRPDPFNQALIAFLTGDDQPPGGPPAN